MTLTQRALVPLAEWLSDPNTIDDIEALFGRRREPTYARTATLHVRSTDDYVTCDVGCTRFSCTRAHKLHERDAAVWLVERLREMYP